jgi:hypothetical protein
MELRMWFAGWIPRLTETDRLLKSIEPVEEKDCDRSDAMTSRREKGATEKGIRPFTFFPP